MGGNSSIFETQTTTATPLSLPFDVLVNGAPIITKGDIPDLTKRYLLQTVAMNSSNFVSSSINVAVGTGFWDFMKETRARVPYDKYVFPIAVKNAANTVFNDLESVFSSAANVGKSAANYAMGSLYTTKVTPDFSINPISAISSQVPNVLSQSIQMFPISSNTANFQSAHSNVAASHAGSLLTNSVDAVARSLNPLSMQQNAVNIGGGVYSAYTGIFTERYYSSSAVDAVINTLTSMQSTAVQMIPSSVNSSSSANPAGTVDATSAYAHTAINNLKGALGTLADGVRLAFSNRLEYAIAKASVETLGNLTNTVAAIHQQAEDINQKYEVERWRLEQDRKQKEAEIATNNAQFTVNHFLNVQKLLEDSKTSQNQFLLQLAATYSSSALNTMSAVASFMSDAFNSYLKCFTVLDSGTFSSIVNGYLDYDFRMKALKQEYRRHQDAYNLQAYAGAASGISDYLTYSWQGTLRMINLYREAISAYSASPTPPLITKDTAFGAFMKGLSSVAGIGAQVAQIASIL